MKAFFTFLLFIFGIGVCNAQLLLSTHKIDTTSHVKMNLFSKYEKRLGDLNTLRGQSLAKKKEPAIDSVAIRSESCDTCSCCEQILEWVINDRKGDVVFKKSSECSCCQKLLYQWLKKEKKDDDNRMTKEEKETKEQFDDFPNFKILGAGSISGNVDSVVSKSARLQFVFQPNSRWSVYGTVNKGTRTDTLSVGENVSPKIILFPDADHVGFQLGITSNLRIKNFGAGQQIMQLSFSPVVEYSLQRRNFFSRDSSLGSREFFAGNLLIGGTIRLAGFMGKNNCSLETTLGMTKINIANNDLDDYRSLFSYALLQNNATLTDKFFGFHFQESFLLNNTGIFYRYENVTGHDNQEVKGLTKGQHFFGIQLAAKFWEW